MSLFFARTQDRGSLTNHFGQIACVDSKSTYIPSEAAFASWELHTRQPFDPIIHFEETQGRPLIIEGMEYFARELGDQECDRLQTDVLAHQPG